eukprot:5157068-Pleurochrysis_carterae.AAC.1
MASAPVRVAQSARGCSQRAGVTRGAAIQARACKRKKRLWVCAPAQSRVGVKEHAKVSQVTRNTVVKPSVGGRLVLGVGGMLRCTSSSPKAVGTGSSQRRRCPTCVLPSEVRAHRIRQVAGWVHATGRCAQAEAWGSRARSSEETLQQGTRRARGGAGEGACARARCERTRHDARGTGGSPFSSVELHGGYADALERLVSARSAAACVRRGVASRLRLARARAISVKSPG